MNNRSYSAHSSALDRTAVDRGALDYLVNRNQQQSNCNADPALARLIAQDSRLADERARIASARIRLEQHSGAMAIAGVILVVLLVASLSLVMEMPVAEQPIRILAAGVAIVLFGLLIRPARGELNLLLPLHVAVCVSLLSEGGWHANHSPVGWDMTLLLLGIAAAVAGTLRDMRMRSLDIDEADLVLKARGRLASIELTRRWEDASI